MKDGSICWVTLCDIYLSAKLHWGQDSLVTWSKPCTFYLMVSSKEEQMPFRKIYFNQMHLTLVKHKFSELKKG